MIFDGQNDIADTGSKGSYEDYKAANDDNSKTDLALTATTYLKMFKGNCNHCGRQGHKSANCWAKHGKDGVKDSYANKKKAWKPSGKPDTRTCYNCQQKRHISKDCPKKTENGMFVEDFVGMTGDVCHSVDDSFFDDWVMQDTDHDQCGWELVGATDDICDDSSEHDQFVPVRSNVEEDLEWLDNVSTQSWLAVSDNEDSDSDDDVPELISREWPDDSSSDDEVPELISSDDNDSDIDSEDDVPELTSRQWSDDSDDDDDDYDYSELSDEDSEDDEDDPAFIAVVENEASNVEAEHWLIDSGATVHVTNDDNCMTDIKPCIRRVVIGDGTWLKPTKQGTIKLTNRENQVLILHNVLHVPSFTKNIISVAMLMTKGNTLRATLTAMVLERNGAQMSFEKHAGMFYFHGLRVIESQANVVDTANQRAKRPQRLDINEAHDRMGDFGESMLRDTYADAGVTLTGTLKACDGCLRAKAKRKAILKVSATTATEPGERICVDISGPYSPSIRGSIYWGNMVDENTNKT